MKYKHIIDIKDMEYQMYEAKINCQRLQP
jgi:hypothetical protein